jgi:hypothetical protein
MRYTHKTSPAPHIYSIQDAGERSILAGIILSSIAPLVLTNKEELFSNLKEISELKIHGGNLLQIAGNLKTEFTE